MWVRTPPNDNCIPLIGKNNADGGFSAGERVFEITGTGTWGSIIDPEPAGNLAVNGHSLGGAVTNQSVVVLDDDNWHMVTCVHDDTLGNTAIALYIDGEPQPLGTATFNNNGKEDVGNVFLGLATPSSGGGQE